MKPSLPVRLITGLISILLSVFGLATLGSFIPTIPVLGELGPTLTAMFGPWIVILSALGAIWAYKRARANGRRRTMIVAALAGLAALGMSFIQYQQIKVATIHGAKISLVEALKAGPQAVDGLKVESITYTQFEGQGLPMDLIRPAPRTDGKAAPIFIYVHGGGWGAQTLKQREADTKWFADRGYLAISIDYTLSTKDRHTWNIAEPQLGCALAWINANAARYGGDPARIALWGESAGGNLVLNLAYRANLGSLTPSCLGSLPVIRAVAALYPVVDPARMYRPVDPILGVFGRMMGDNYTGGSPERYPDRYKAIASATHISAKAPPTLLIIPEADHLVDPAAAYGFEEKTRAARVETRLIRMPYAEHSFDIKSGSIGNQMVRQTMLQFLAEQGLKP